jgi:N-acetyl sugar amidotransferase
MTYPPLWPASVESRVRAEARNLDPQERPDHVQFCTRCVISNQRPRIVFDAEGICSACRLAEQRPDIDWEVREGKLRTLLGKHRRPLGYDVIVPCSGGKDSATVAHRLKHEFGMRPLCVKFAPFIYTGIGRKNWERFAHAGFDCEEFFPNGLLHRRLARLAFEYLGDPFQPFVYGQLAYPVQAAVREGVKLIFGAENGEGTYGGDTSANDKPCWDFKDWDRIYLKGMGITRLLHLGKDAGAFTEEDARGLAEAYRLPPPEKLTGLAYHWFAHYKDHHPQANYYYAAEHTGFETNDERSEGTYSKYASLDDKLDGLHYYMGFIKFGIGRATSDAAHEIRDGEITRDEGIALVDRFDGEFPKKHFSECLDYLGLDEPQFWKVVDRYRSKAVWSPNGQVIGKEKFSDPRLWTLRYKVAA